MYAVIEIAGRQERVESGSCLDVNRLKGEVGGEHVVSQVLLAHDGNAVHIGKPYVTGAKVVCEVLEHRLGPKEISYHFRRRENWRKTVGHRQTLTRLLVKNIVCGSDAPAVQQAGISSDVKAVPTKTARAARKTSAEASKTRTKPKASS